ncbi:uncharacterized protein LOC142463605 isoform X2 [Ascaphus truei]|uniref:uncharacterized protein LOC142463605 isoform X2 n=1 Tax=Ascaphus truei TaxID=8439 RepID=UPI003F5A3F2D
MIKSPHWKQRDFIILGVYKSGVLFCTRSATGRVNKCFPSPPPTPPSHPPTISLASSQVYECSVSFSGNFLPLNEQVEWTKEYEDMICQLEDADVEPNFTDFIVPIFVYSARKDVADKEVEEMKTIFKNCRDLTGIYPIIVLTNKTSGNFSRLRDIFEGLGAEEILAVENYTEEDHVKTRGRHMQFLKLIHKVLEDVNFRMQEERNPRKERAERKKFLLKFVHNRDTKQ